FDIGTSFTAGQWLSARSPDCRGGNLVRAFMIAAGRYGVDVSVSDTRFDPPRSGRDRPGIAERAKVAGIKSSGTQSRSAKANAAGWQSCERRRPWRAWCLCFRGGIVPIAATGTGVLLETT